MAYNKNPAIKIACIRCGCIIRMSEKWRVTAGMPICGCGGDMRISEPRIYAKRQPDVPKIFSNDAKVNSLGRVTPARIDSLNRDIVIENLSVSSFNGSSSKKEKKETATAPQLPEILMTPAFIAVWKDRLEERAEKKSRGRLTPKNIEFQLRRLADVARINGIDYAIKCVEDAIAAGWHATTFTKNFIPLTEKQDKASKKKQVVDKDIGWTFDTGERWAGADHQRVSAEEFKSLFPDMDD